MSLRRVCACGGKKYYYALACRACTKLQPRRRRPRIISPESITAAQAERFWAKVTKIEGVCWEWMGYRAAFGYGHVSLGDRIETSHRVAYLLCVGPIPEGMCVCHSCDNPPCCNPAHLFLGTRADNNHDMMAKGRFVTIGERHHSAKLSEIDVRAIRAAHGFVPQRDLSEAFGVRREHIRIIQNKRGWRHVA